MSSQIQPRRMAPFEYSFKEDDLNAASDAWGCNCGPTALAAMLGITLDDVRPLIPNFEQRRYTNPTMMQRALRAAGVSYAEVDDAYDRENLGAHAALPIYGLVRVQWEGPWLNPGVPPAAAYKYTHWIGTQKYGAAFYVFDVNCGWCGLNEWMVTTAPSLVAMYKRATGGWRYTHRWELQIQEGGAG